MVILVPAEGEDQAKSMRRNQAVVPDMAGIRKGLRNGVISATSSVRGRSRPGDRTDFESRQIPKIGRADDETQLYAQYLRGGSPTGSSLDLNQMKGREDSIVSEA